MIIHNIEPLIYDEAHILILGSFPSVQSRADGFFYMHKQNRFYKVLSAIYDDDFYQATIEEKKILLKKHRIALFDIVAACTIEGSSDAKIRDVTPQPIPDLIRATKIAAIFVNGKEAARLMQRFYPQLPITVLPSTSPANAQWSLPQLIDAWRVIAHKKST